MTSGTAVRGHLLYVEMLIAFAHYDMAQILQDCLSVTF